MTTTTEPATYEGDIREEGIGAAFRDYVARVRGGDTGSLPAVLGFIVLFVFFAVMSDTFTSKGNLANLLNQSAAYVFIAMGLVFVLLLGEIDLGAGYTAGTSAAMLGVVMTKQGYAWPIAVVACLVTGAVIGLTVGLIVSRLGIPSFVVTLAYFLGLQGVLLLVIGEGGTIPIRDETILAVNNNNLTPILGWVLFVLVVGGYAAATLSGVARRKSAGLPSASTSVVVLKIVALAVLLGGATLLLNQERSVNPALNSLKGVPIIVPFTIVFLVLLTFVLSRTSFGRHVYAVGGNAEAARRAGINVGNIKVACFVIGSTLAALGGIVLASRDNSVSPQSGGSSTLLLSVAAAVIGGTSLFGGKGRIIDAVVGGLVIGVIYNGLPLITQQAGIQFVVTAGVLLLAASVDAIARRQSAASGK